MIIRSKVNSVLTLQYMQNEPENKYFDRKSAQINAAQLAQHISAFANASGGTIIIGISDKDHNLEGINHVGETKINEFLNAPKDCCKPMPVYQEEFIDIINEKGKPDRLLLLHIATSMEQVIRTTGDKTYLRIGDKSKEMLGDNLKNLEYAKGTRHYENELNIDASLEDLDEKLLESYKTHIGAEDMDNEQVLRARGFIRERDGKICLTNAAVLLFAKNIRQFYQNCRIRFIRYDGMRAQVGTDINIIRDVSLDYPLLKIIDEARSFIATQLREFLALDEKSGKFQVVPEYPPFAWLEGIVNAVTHREYAMTGSYIKVTMYDDRLEIESPGKLPNIVTVDNIKDTRYSRNSSISRVLTEFGWVRELNEGVKRIYKDMENFFLDDPKYKETDQSVRLILKNNIIMRKQRQQDRAIDRISEDIWMKLDDLEKKIITYMVAHGSVNRASLDHYLNKSSGTVRNRLNHLIELNLIKTNGSRYAPTMTYELVE